jgi:hypothetical protein
MRKISVSKAFAAQVAATNAGRIKWPAQRRPLTDKERAELAAIEAAPPRLSGYERHLASGNDFLSRFKREHADLYEAAAKADTTTND